MSFIPEASKQTPEITFSIKLKYVLPHPMVFNEARVSLCKSQKR